MSSCLVTHLRADAQAPLQALLVFRHAKGEVSVPAVHRADPALQLRHVGVAFLHQVVRQLDQKLHLFLGLLRVEGTHSVTLTNILVSVTKHAH